MEGAMEGGHGVSDHLPSAVMNYQHAFHAGNFADVHKHVVLARILDYLRGKPAAFRVIDTHAGAGLYDLAGEQASRSGEWRDGIARLLEAAPTKALQDLLAPYLGAVTVLNPGGGLRCYPGSPLLARALMRSQDRLIACELEPRSAAALKAALRGERRAKVIAIDGWTALGAMVPPVERRGLVLIDPSFEDAADFARLPAALATAHRKWPSGIYLLWYPIKDRDAPDALARRLARLAVPKILRSEIMLSRPRADAGLIGSGLVIVNPPFTLEAELRVLLPGLARIFAPQGAARIDWLAHEGSPGGRPGGAGR
jgi:23S rRNA (adenine2030-N6)-methyltransferase